MDNKTSYPVKRSFCISERNMLKGVMAFLFFSVAITTHAQIYTACFNMNTTQVCPGQTVTFTDCSGSIAGILNTDDAATIQLDASAPSNSHTYNTPGIFHPFQIVNDGGSGNSTSPTQTVTVVDNVSSPAFTIDNCAGNQVTVHITDTNYDTYEIAWGDGNFSTALPSGTATYTYAASSTYSISVTGKFTSATCVSTPVSLSITTLNALIAPVIADLTINTQQMSGSATLRFYALPNQQYQIEEQQGGGGYVNKTTVQYQSGLQSLTFFGIPTSVDPFYYRIHAYDACGSFPAYSDDVYSVVLNGTASNHQNDLSWFDYHTFLAANFDHYEVWRDGSFLFSTTSNTYTDFAVTCQQTYGYQILTYTNTGQIAYSAYVPVTAISTDVPTTLVNPNVSVVNGQTLLAWDAPTGGFFTPVTYQIQRADNGNPFLNIGTSSGTAPTQYFDFGSSPTSSSMCYQIAYTDVCLNTSAYSAVTCPVLLQMTTSTTANTLSWSNYIGYYASGIQGYEVEVLDANGSVIRTIPVGMALNYVDPVDPSASLLRYRIKVISVGTENLISNSNIVDVSFASQLYIPTAFSPNQDGNNDKFLIKGRYVKDYQMTIFNQWGEAIFYSNDPNYGWDGTYKGENCVVDDYTWLVKATDNTGDAITEKGVVTLVR
jgi:gliding motility-associated-like protein